MPPFVAPPVDRDKKRLWIGLGVGALALLVCCVGGIVGGVLLFAGGTREMQIQAKEVVTEYLGALTDEEYPAAYNLLCSDVTDVMPFQQFERRYRDDPVTDFSIGNVSASDSDLSVAAVVRFELRGTVQQEYLVRSTMAGMAVCGLP